MRRLITLVAAAAILVTACGSGSTPSPSAPSPSPSPPGATPTPSPSPTPEVTAEVRFDGKTCTFLGPKVVVSGTRMTIDFKVGYQPETAAAAAVAAVKEGTSQEIIDRWFADADGKDMGYPPYYVGVASETFALKNGPGAVVVVLRDLTNAHAWTVDCVTFDAAHIQRNAALIQVVSS